MGETKNVQGTEITKPEKLSFEEFTQKLGKLEQELYDFPVGSYEHIATQQNIQELLMNQGGKYNKFVLCFPSVHHASYPRLANEFPTLEWASNHLGVVELDSNLEEEGLFFSQHDTFVTDKKFIAIPRYQAEYNLNFKQIVVCSFITDGLNVILLHTKKGGQTRIEDRYTMIQGHVEFDRRAYIMPQYRFLHENAKMEFNEEIKTNLELRFPRKPKLFVSSRDNHIDLEHFGVVYEIFVPNAEEVYQQLTSGEENKHSVILFDITDRRAENYEKLDTWARLVIDHLQLRLYS